MLLAACTTLLVRSNLLRARTGSIALVSLFLGYGFLIATWRFWYDVYRYTRDNTYPLLSAVLVFVFAFLIAPMRPLLATLSAAVFVALSPIHTPMIILAVLCAFGIPAATPKGFFERNRTVLQLALVALVVGAVVYAIPWLLIWSKDYASGTSSLVFRSGLDGDTRYFTSIVQAMVAPCGAPCCGGRTIWELLFPAFLPLVVFGVLASRDRSDLNFPLGRQLLFLCTPYLVSLVVFPQSISVHPYLYDHLLLLPVVSSGVMAALTKPVQSRIKGMGLLVFLVFMIGLIMSNLISIAQGLTRVGLTGR